MFGTIKRRKIFLLAAVGVLALGLTGGVVLAQAGGSDQERGQMVAMKMTGDTMPKGAFAARVAEILGLDEQVVQDAFDQAARDQINEAYRARLDRMVEAGRLTQEEADEQYNWFESRPETPLEMQGYGRGDRRSVYSRGFRGGGREFHRGRHDSMPTEKLMPDTPTQPAQ